MEITSSTMKLLQEGNREQVGNYPSCNVWKVAGLCPPSIPVAVIWVTSVFHFHPKVGSLLGGTVMSSSSRSPRASLWSGAGRG